MRGAEDCQTDQSAARGVALHVLHRTGKGWLTQARGGSRRPTAHAGLRQTLAVEVWQAFCARQAQLLMSNYQQQASLITYNKLDQVQVGALRSMLRHRQGIAGAATP